VVSDCDDDVGDDVVDAKVDEDEVGEDNVVEARFEVDGATTRSSRIWLMTICLRGIK
jgi:hypothetical protein